MTSRQLRILLASIGTAFFYVALIVGLYKQQTSLALAGVVGLFVEVGFLRRALKAPAFTHKEWVQHDLQQMLTKVRSVDYTQRYRNLLERTK